ncbi:MULTISPECIES: thiol reductant ABC exporter subunit CydD [unclassified Cryobacterium]|uniref:thiol reductant ABC exporter subunit CydD n=1 Tax=unclassified Cryobacterium TaxID=2649013 RepID=UPI00106C3E01|nr:MULTISPECIES: thiol reductant ABC exporter subunit CydD [unclassified Cryobacterium]TFD03588.1 thiol reductant ABC exporter subunit CydD [Cryobacterium sp. TMT1-66-1]TFD12851.1 thiol reductant ABC exporter subunit CydD [Cryobacterium sp. TMT1-2-2]
MRPLDPRLLRYAHAARRFLLIGALLGFAQTLVVIAFAWLLTRAITLTVAGEPLSTIMPTLAALAGVVVLRSVLIWLLEVAANRGAAQVKSQLRARVMAKLAERGPDWVASQQSARLSTVVTTGLDALDNYFARYLPQLLLTMIATPILIAVILWQDLASGLTVIIVIPLIPVFMILIGKVTQSVQQEQWQALQRLSTGFLDVVGGLGTLKIYGRERRQFDRIRSITEEYRTRTMKVLRVSFLSGFVLELAASLSVALLAVSIGLRLIDGALLLGVGLFVLLLAPEAFLPLRQVGAQFHAAADGLAAAEELFTILDDDSVATVSAVSTADAAAGAGLVAPHAGQLGQAAGALRLAGVTVRRGDSVVIHQLHAEFAPGQLSVLRGVSGVGKSTLVAALLGFVPYTGTLTLGGEAVTAGAPRPWLAWSGQRPGLFRGTVAENVALGAASAEPGLIVQALDWAGAAEVLPSNVLGVNGDGLSGGQAQRVGAARAIYRALATECHVLILDEPSSALDSDAEAGLLAGLRHLADQGRVVIVVSHRPAVVAAADHVIELQELIHV